MFGPPSVKGWDGGEAWLNSNATLMRLNWTAELLSGNQRAGLPPSDPRHWIEQHGIKPSDAIETFSAQLLQNDVNAATLSLVQKLAGAARQPNMPAALQMFLQTPEY